MILNLTTGQALTVDEAVEEMKAAARRRNARSFHGLDEAIELEQLQVENEQLRTLLRAHETCKLA